MRCASRIGWLGRPSGWRVLGASVTCACVVDLSAPIVQAQEPPPPVQLTQPVAIPPAPPDSVVLRNGGLIRGRIQEILPGDHLTIAMETGEMRRIAWSDVERVIVAASTKIPPMPRTTEPPRPLPAPELPPPPMRGPLVWVHITSPKHVTLNRRLDEGADWVHACDSPCDVELPLGDQYEIAGLGNGPSKDFHLKGAAGQSVVLTIEPPSVSGIILGGSMVALGGLSLYISVLVGLGTSAACAGQSCGTNGGYVAAGVSAGAMAVGGIILYLSAKTDINQHETAPAPAAPPQTGLLREPMWRTPDLLSASAPSFSLPIFSRSF